MRIVPAGHGKINIGDIWKTSQFGDSKLAENEGFEPAIPGSDPVQRDLQESNPPGSDPMTDIDIQPGDWVLAYKGDADGKQFAVVTKCENDRFGPACHIYFPRGGGRSRHIVSTESVERVSDEEVPPQYHDPEVDAWIADLRGQSAEMQNPQLD